MPPRRRSREDQESVADIPAVQPEVVEEPFHKIEKQFREQRPPTFNRLGKPFEAELWVQALDRIFEYMRCPDATRVTCALFQLTEEADYWWESVQRTLTLEERDALTWEGLKMRFFEKYMPRCYRNRKEIELLSLKQGQQSVIEYDRVFTQLSCHAPHLVDSDRKKADRFRRGLIPKISMPLVGQGGLSYAQSVSRAPDIESVMPRSLKTPAAATEPPADNKMRWDNQKLNPHDNQAKKPLNGNTQRGQGNQQNPQQGRPPCRRCRRYHTSPCRDGVVYCYKCGQIRHMAKDCRANPLNANARQNQDGNRGSQAQGHNRDGPSARPQNAPLRTVGKEN